MIDRAQRRLAKHGVASHLLGLLLRRHFWRAGIITVLGGWSLPTVENLGGRIEIGNCTLFTGVRLEVWKDAEIVIGNGTYLNRNTEIVAGRSVRIGQDCMIARDVLIMDTDQHALPGQELRIAPVVLEDRVWVGARAIILKGVHIGHDSMIGAGAIVTKSVPPFTVVAGPAARPIRHLGRPAERSLSDQPASELPATEERTRDAAH